jgi:hypothetical protein
MREDAARQGVARPGNGHQALADGSRRKYFYAWRGGPMLKDDAAPLQLGDPRLVTAYADAHKARTKPATGTLHSLIAAIEPRANSPSSASAPRKIISGFSA